MDYDEVYKLWGMMEKGVRVSRSDSLDEIKKKVARDPDLFLVAVSDNMIIGSVIGGFDGRRGMVYHLAVASEFRGMGIGSRLMNELESRLRSKGCLKCYLLVTLDNSDAEAYYQHRDWKCMDDLHIYGKELQ